MYWASYLPFLPPSVLTNFLQLLWRPISAAFQSAQYEEFQGLCFQVGLPNGSTKSKLDRKGRVRLGHIFTHLLTLIPRTPMLTILSVHLPMKETATRWPLAHRDPHFLILIL